MDKPVWKAGDTCQIKPSRKHSVLKAKCARLWTVYDVSGDDALVHDGPAGMPSLSGPGWTCSARVPLDCLLPPGEAHPTVAAEMGAEVLRLRARVAELEATLANERGEGEPPVEGWEWSQAESMPDPCWHRGESVAYMEQALDTDPPLPAHFWLWWSPGMPCCQRAATARDAMRAASGAPDAHP